MTDKQFQKLLEKIPFQMIMHMNCDKTHIHKYLNKDLNIMVEKHCKVKEGGINDIAFYIAEVESKTYKTLRRLMEDNSELIKKAEQLYGKDS